MHLQSLNKRPILHPPGPSRGFARDRLFKGGIAALRTASVPSPDAVFLYAITPLSRCPFTPSLPHQPPDLPQPVRIIKHRLPIAPALIPLFHKRQGGKKIAEKKQDLSVQSRYLTDNMSVNLWIAGRRILFRIF